MFDRLIPYALVALILVAYAIVGTIQFNDMIEDNANKSTVRR